MPWYLQAVAIVFGVALIWFIAASMKRDDRKRFPGDDDKYDDTGADE
jgi:hypothetical protein